MEDIAVIRERVRTALGQYPPLTVDEFDRSWHKMSDLLNSQQLSTWADVGIRLAGQTVRSWESAAQYYKASAKIVSLMPFSRFEEWAACGLRLCQDSPTLAACYFNASQGVLQKLRARHVEAWAMMGRRLYKGTWKSSTLACKFFESSPKLVQSLDIEDLDRFVAFLEYVSRRSYDVATDCIVLGERIFPALGEHNQAFIAMSYSVAETGWRQVKSVFDATARSLPRVQASQRGRFIALSDALRESGAGNLSGSMLEVSQALWELDNEYHEYVLEMSEDLMQHAPSAIPDFIKSCPKALERVTILQLQQWYLEGVRVLQRNRDAGMAYFRLESAHSQSELDALSANIEFERIKELMEMYCQALAGAEVKVAASEELAEKRIGWLAPDSPTTEGSTVYVPAIADRYQTKEENFALFKVVSTHQVARLEFGSFWFEFDTPSTVFKDLRPTLERKVLEATGSNGDGTESVTDIQRLFSLLEDRRLSLDLFTIIEGGRLDIRVLTEYLGMRKSYARVQTDALASRPEITQMPAREAMVEFLVRVTLREDESLPTPVEYVDEARKIASIARRANAFGTTVEDTAEAMLRIYAVLIQIPNVPLDEDEFQDLDLGDNPDESSMESEAEDDIIQSLMEGLGAESQEKSPGEQEYETSQDVDYRGDFKPEMVQLLEQLRLQKGSEGSADGDSQEITQEMLQELIQNSAELDLDAMEFGEAEDMTADMAQNMLKEASMTAPSHPDRGQGQFVHVDEDGGPIDPDEPQTFVYDEWDFRAEDYKPRWCVVRQKQMSEGDPAYYGQTLAGYSTLVNQIRRQFELLVPEMFRKQRKLEDGEEIDIDDVIEAMVDIRTGSSPSDKLYWRRNKVQRDVAVVFLLDTSASTAEAVDESRKGEDWDAPDDPVEYMTWLRTRRGEGMRRSYKRIIDLEKEACVLLINALEAVGDRYGIYAFSGYGRENVEFYTIKDIEENFSDSIKRRIDRVSPLHATRMGPAIRHATTKLDALDAKTKLLFLISDGRPQDRGYSREGVEKEYAVHDTKMALDEAKAKDITAFALTVDKNGHDYLATMCQDMGYEILDDILQLPRRLLFLYRRLTM